jgi:hypothetical protein
MKKHALAALFVLAAGAVAWAQGDLEAGRKLFERCAACHAVPDSRLRWDKSWYDRVVSSPCAAPAPPKGKEPPPLDDRRPLLAFLGAESTPRPARVDFETPITPDLGTVSPNFEEGYVLLVPRKEDAREKDKVKEMASGYRLVWKKDEKERRRPIPGGSYQLRRYVVSKDDPKTGEWTVCATGEGRIVNVKGGEELKLSLDLDVSFSALPAMKGTKVTVGGTFRGDRKMGVTILKNNKLLEVAWKVYEGKQELAAGGCAYGAEGVFAGVLDLLPTQRLGAGQAKYYFDISMYKVKGDPREASFR